VKLNQVTVLAHDYDASVAFYLALGLTQIPPRHARFECDNGATFSLPVEAGRRAVGGTAVCFEVDDLDATVERFRRAGISFAGAAR
jgi:hydroxymethylpyrimidine/phosphomethylpyrimidine kinase